MQTHLAERLRRGPAPASGVDLYDPHAGEGAQSCGGPAPGTTPFAPRRGPDEGTAGALYVDPVSTWQLFWGPTVQLAIAGCSVLFHWLAFSNDPRLLSDHATACGGGRWEGRCPATPRRCFRPSWR